MNMNKFGTFIGDINANIWLIINTKQFKIGMNLEVLWNKSSQILFQTGSSLYITFSRISLAQIYAKTFYWAKYS